MNAVNVRVRLAKMERSAWRTDLTVIHSKLPGVERGRLEIEWPTIEAQQDNALFGSGQDNYERPSESQQAPTPARRLPESRAHES